MMGEDIIEEIKEAIKEIEEYSSEEKWCFASLIHLSIDLQQLANRYRAEIKKEYEHKVFRCTTGLI